MNTRNSAFSLIKIAPSQSRPRRARRDRLSGILAGMREGYAELDATLRFVLVNRSAENILGQPTSRILGRTPSDLFGPEFAVPLERKFRSILGGTEEIQFKEDLDISTRKIEIRAQRAGEGLILFFNDVTAARLAEETLQQESEKRRIVEERFEAALSVSQIVVFKMDRDLKYSWVYNNQIGERDMEAVGNTPETYFEPESSARLTTFFRSVIATGRTQRIELALTSRRAPEERHFVSSARPIFNDRHDVVGLTGASIEITSVVRQREELARAREEAMIAKAEAERASLSKSKFLAAASHDLRQPVQSLLLLIEVLKHQLAGSTSRKAIDQMEKAVDALHLLFDSLLDISKLDAGVIVPVVRNVCLNTLIGRLAEEYRLRAEHQSLDFRFVPTSAFVRTDPVLVERVLRNLLENALRYCPSGRVLLGCRRLDRAIRIDVIDTGIGIAIDHLDEIFEEFHQVANTARDRNQGLGLGLSIVKKIMRLLDGTVSVHSALGRGSRFSISLPLSCCGRSGEPPATAERDEGLLVLVIEDDDLLRDSLDIMLRNWSYRTMTAGSGEEALSLIERINLPDIIISDYRLSAGLSGIDTVLRINEKFGQAIPSVIITGDTAPERVREVHSSGLRILHKPVAAEELRRALLSMARQYPPRPANATS